MKIDGRAIAGDIIAHLKERKIPKKILAVIFVGDDPHSLGFIKQKGGVARELGIDFRIYKLGRDLKNDGLRKEIGRIARQKPVGGVLVQLPLPGGLNRRYILNAIPAKKNVDLLGERRDMSLLSPSVETVREILGRTSTNFEESEVVVLGVGELVGRPIAEWFKGKCKRLSVIDEKDSRASLTTADLVISGVGRAGVLDTEMLQSDAGVIDFGYDIKDEGGVGDLVGNTEKLKFYTPTPGGTGPILVAKLFENFYTLCEKQSQ